MREVTDDDWKEYTFPTATNSILASIMDGQPCAFHLYWVSMLYKRYRLGDWNGVVPLASALADQEVLIGYNDDYCIFHKDHEKFGRAILEGVSPYNPRAFVFFDYATLQIAFDALDADEQLPYIPTYYAHPHDRHDYKTGAHMW
ncbi:hypothetical protein [Pseudovibrio sp. Ad37]|uniref:hypothetical protein n=1 Tax=Pseudovibrio sp. Ad37 TaxID=989422 RepID=UPI0007AE5CF8|nr:hypothetical protein [Pseudovibrio sp. Ad37]KZL15775.1 hypothetical protein PsAD37_04253 [Pseudovibrio sp. Ad37]